MSYLTVIATILISSIIIYYASKRFADASSFIGDYLRLPKSVKGATFDAISSSLPEILVALYSVLFFQTFEVGVGTIAGSALFNLLVIPGLAVFVAPVAFKVHKRVVSRDALFYLMAVFVLVVLLIYVKFWGMAVAVFLLAMYFWYLRDITRDSRENRKNVKFTHKKGIGKELIWGLITVVIIGAATFFLTESSIELAHLLGISPIIIAFTVIAAATSVPDTIVSLVNAKKGSIDDATSNVFGSNVFDIFVGIGLPLFIFSIMKGGVNITFGNLEIVLGLLGATIIVLYFLMKDHTLTVREGTFLIFMYLVFLAYIILLSLNIF